MQQQQGCQITVRRADNPSFYLFREAAYPGHFEYQQTQRLEESFLGGPASSRVHYCTFASRLFQFPNHTILIAHFVSAEMKSWLSPLQTTLNSGSSIFTRASVQENKFKFFPPCPILPMKLMTPADYFPLVAAAATACDNFCIFQFFFCICGDSQPHSMSFLMPRSPSVLGPLHPPNLFYVPHCVCM